MKPEETLNEREKIDAKKLYEEWFLKRPPFSVKIERPPYKGVDVGSTYLMEAKVFSADEIVENLQISSKNPKILEAQSKVIAYGAALRENIAAIERTSHNEQKTLQEKAGEATLYGIQAVLGNLLEGLQSATGKPSRALVERTVKKNLYREHHNLKKLYFQSILILLTLWNRELESQGERDSQVYKENEMLYHQTEAVHLAHQTYSTVLTFVHDFDPLRESGDIVMDHAYNICIRGMAKHLKRIHQPGASHEEKIAIFKELKKSIVVRLCHDMGEDFREQWNSKVFEDTIKRIAGGFDSRILNLLFGEGKPIEVQNPHFISEEWESIERMINALTKPKEKAKREGYLERQTLGNAELTEEELREVLDIKVDDRLDNLATLKYMKGKPTKGETRIQTQLRKIEETLEILDINLKYCEANPAACEQIKENAQDLISACMSEISRMRREMNLLSNDGAKAVQLLAQLYQKKALFSN